MTVSDTGIGIPADKQNRIFERFYRAEESRNKFTGGSGLGLAICKHIVEKHKGSLTISSTEGEGATFIVTLPAMSESDVSVETDNDILAKQEAAEEMTEGSDAADNTEEKELLKRKKEKKRKKAKKRKAKDAEQAEKQKTAKEEKTGKTSKAKK